MPGDIALYSAVHDILTHYEVDIEAAVLTKRNSIRMPAKVQYAWPHPSRPILYISTSNGGPKLKSDQNHVTAYSVAADGSLAQHGESKPFARRAVHMCLDPSGRYALNGHNAPTSGITVHRIKPDGSLGDEIVQDATLNYGNYPHQVMVSPSGRTAIIVDRGVAPKADRPESPGALRTFGFVNGKLSAGQVVAPNGGFGFGPRHLDFHPSLPLLYVSDERMNRLHVFRFDGDQLGFEPAYVREMLADPGNVRPRQLGGPIHFHPTKPIVYLANRADYMIDVAGKRVFGGGENNIAVYSVDKNTGEPTLIQNADTHSSHVRTFACDPSGRLLVTASIKRYAVLEGQEVKTIAAALSVFRIRDDGKLEFVRKYDVETSDGQMQYWMGINSIK
jgi:6-phosphogluconolactonase (cycloisomerase 2 family)